MKIILFNLLFFSTFLLAAQNIETANQYYSNQDWKKAVPEYQKITTLNPYNGIYWYRLGYALIKNNQYKEAIAAFQNARPLLASPKNSTYNIACCYSLMGQKEPAIRWLKMAYEEGFTDKQAAMEDSDFKAIKGLKEFAAIFDPPTPKGLDRNQQWCYDLEYLTQIFEKKHIDLFHAVSEKEWWASVHEIEANIPHLSDDQIVGKMMKLIAKVSDGHSNIFPASGSLYFPSVAGHAHAFHGGSQKWQPKTFPIQFELFGDGVFITAASPKYKNIVGAKVLKMGGTDIEDIVNETQAFIGKDNNMQGKMMGVKLLRMREFYEWAGVFKTGEKSSVLVKHFDGKEETVMLETTPLDKDKDIRWEWMNSTTNNPLPLYLQQPDKNYWSHYIKDQKIIWLQYNAVQNHRHGQDLEAFSEELFHFIEKQEVDALIIDVRHNLGGNSFFNGSIVKRIMQSQKINQPGKLFVITGRKTFSAAMNFATDMEKLTHALFVGEPTGSSPNFYGEHNPFQLPFSQVQGSYSSRYYQGGTSSEDHRPWIAPDIISTLTSDDFRENVDPVLEAILRYLGKK